MALQKIYDATPLQVLTTRETRERIRAAAAATGRSQAEVMRALIDMSLPEYERQASLQQSLEF